MERTERHLHGEDKTIKLQIRLYFSSFTVVFWQLILTAHSNSSLQRISITGRI